MPPRPLSSAESTRPPRPLTSGVVVWTGALAVAAFSLTLACAQPQGETAAKTAMPTEAASTARAKAAAEATKPLWNELTTSQQQSLRPLEPHWNTLNIGQKRKWIALSRNYATMSADDRVTLHSRMIEWAALSNQQRTQARLNFAEVKRIPADERKSKWEQYQALSEEEKRKLAERAPAKPRGAAVPVRPVSTQRLVTVPVTAASGQHTPRIQLAPPPSGTATVPATLSVSTTPERATLPSAITTPATPAPAPAPPTYSSPPVPAEAQFPPPAPAEPRPTAP